MKSRSPTVWTIIGVAATVVVTLMIVIPLLLTGGTKAVSDNVALIGAVVALGGIFTTQMVNSALEDRRARETRALEDRRAQVSALQAFIDQISDSDTYSKLRTAPASGHERAVLRAKMQTLLLQLNDERKGVLLSFLHGAKLSRRAEITPYEHTKEGSEERGQKRWNYPILRLDHIDFSRTKQTPDTTLTFDNLESIILRGAKLSDVNLSGANLKKADLRDADLSGAALRKPNRQDPQKIPGEFHDELDKTTPEGRMETFPEGWIETDLSEADLRGANLSRADLRGAVGITNADLEKQAASLKDAIMPDGSKHP